jgi:RNA polymerase sigma factor (sigma-70 family)
MSSHPASHDQLAALDDAALIRLARTSAADDPAGDETSRRCVAMVLLRHRSLIRAAIAAKVPRDSVDDLCSDVYVRFVGRVHTGSEITNPAGLLIRICQRVRADHLAARRAPTSLLDGWEPGATDDALDGLAVQDAVERLLKPLDERQREVVWSRILDGRTSAEVAARLDTTPGNIDVIMFRALQRMREAAR